MNVIETIDEVEEWPAPVVQPIVNSLVLYGFGVMYQTLLFVESFEHLKQ